MASETRFRLEGEFEAFEPEEVEDICWRALAGEAGAEMRRSLRTELDPWETGVVGRLLPLFSRMEVVTVGEREEPE